MIEALRNAFRIPDLRKKILFTLAIIALYRVGAHIPVPGIDPVAVKELVSSSGNNVLGMLNLFAGGALENFAVFALGIMPYITATIIMQLLQAVIPTVERWAKEGESGQRKITQTARYMTLAIALVQSLGYLTVFQAPSPAGLGVQLDRLTEAVIVISLVAGTGAIMWMGELITQRGIGNGMSLLIFASIVARFPQTLLSSFRTQPWMALILLVLFFGIIVAVVFMDRGQRRIPVQYSKRVVGRRVYGGMGTYIPLKINAANVIPIIFASSILMFPATIAQFFPSVAWLQRFSEALTGGWLNILLYAILIVFFTYFYTALVFNPIETADSLRKNGGFIPGVRPGKATAQHIETVLNRITLPGALFLAFIAVLPQILFIQTQNQMLQSFGGTSILIMVGVALETMRQLESQLQMRHYDGFFD